MLNIDKLTYCGNQLGPIGAKRTISALMHAKQMDCEFHDDKIKRSVVIKVRVHSYNLQDDCLMILESLVPLVILNLHSRSSYHIIFRFIITNFHISHNLSTD